MIARASAPFIARATAPLMAIVGATVGPSPRRQLVVSRDELSRARAERERLELTHVALEPPEHLLLEPRL